MDRRRNPMCFADATEHCKGGKNPAPGKGWRSRSTDPTNACRWGWRSNSSSGEQRHGPHRCRGRHRLDRGVRRRPRYRSSAVGSHTSICDRYEAESLTSGAGRDDLLPGCTVHRNGGCDLPAPARTVRAAAVGRIALPNAVQAASAITSTALPGLDRPAGSRPRASDRPGCSREGLSRWMSVPTTSPRSSRSCPLGPLGRQ